ncbi:MAG: thermonuclease family protein [Magnetococcales bacterium]|nr:thermonuclease family protein [Magnetococcales bacterium]
MPDRPPNRCHPSSDLRATRHAWRRLTRLLPLLALLWSLPARPERLAGGGTFTGPAAVIDGDSLRVGQREVRLHGVDAWEYDQTCPDRRGRPFACGRQAQEFLDRTVAGRTVTCALMDRDSYRRFVAVCRLDDQDLGALLVRAGWATAYTHYSRRYLPLERQARQERLGGWAGGPDRLPQSPRQWRRH